MKTAAEVVNKSAEMDEIPELYSIFRGEVASIQTYGAFVKIPGCRKNGLVHKTQISNTRVEDVSEVLAVGDPVYCKVISLGEDDSVKISLSMKHVDQGKGKDMDVNQVQTKQEEMRRKKGQSFVQPKIELGAVFNTVCKKCGTRGHLARDCFQMPGSKSYDLLPEDDDLPSLGTSEATAPSAHKKKKKKKEKKKKKSKKHRHKSESSESSDSQSDSSTDERQSRKRRHRAEDRAGKTKKRHRHRSSSSSSSDDDTPPDRLRHRQGHRDKGQSREGRDDVEGRSSSRHKRKLDREASSEGSASGDGYPPKHGHRHGHKHSDNHGDRHKGHHSKPRHR